MLTDKEVAKIVGTTVPGLKNMIRNGEHPPADIVTSSGRFWSPGNIRTTERVTVTARKPKTREQKEVKPTVRPAA